MEQAVMSKRALDTYGGISSLLAGMVCAWFAQQHHMHESIWKVWVAFSVFLLLNGVAMIVYAHRSKSRSTHSTH